MHTASTLTVMRRGDRRLVQWQLIGLPFVVLGTEFAELYLTFRVTEWFAPDVLGEVGDRPAAFAALIALVALPLCLAVITAFSGRVFRALLNGTKPPPSSSWSRWRRFGSYSLSRLATVIAALVVFEGIAEIGLTPLGPVLALTVLGPIALRWLFKGLGPLRRRRRQQITWESRQWADRVRRRWTNRGHRPRHAAPGEGSRSDSLHDDPAAAPSERTDTDDVSNARRA
ncbi:hypothetical protein AB0M02_25070 [Actinoplanes sp. NPDC051861]|uniref:hypothetical protein n=1 Tax=Actinoplanes sp. NPDC051861 TaxID=3155170 RepID=UPI0034425A32